MVRDETSRRRRDRVAVALAAAIGFLVATDFAVATNWTVGLDAGSSAQAQAASVSNLTIVAVASPSPTNLLYPGGNGDVVAKVTNPNPFPVTITAVQLPTDLVGAAGYSDSGLSLPVVGCTAALSGVTWNYSTGVSGSSHTLNSALVVAANGNLTVTFTNDASMSSTAPAACEAAYFSMPALISVTASAGGGAPTTSPATDFWNS